MPRRDPRATGPLSLLLALPGAAGILHEVARHLLHRPVTGIVAAAHTEDGRWVLIRRGDTGTWALPGGTLEWGETLREALERELREEAGVTSFALERVVGVYSRPDRDPRFHAVTVVTRCNVALPSVAPMNPLEIREVRLFGDGELPELAMGMTDMMAAARDTSGATVLE
jgi:8-oxo-dGTP diphosphatase